MPARRDVGHASTSATCGRPHSTTPHTPDAPADRDEATGTSVASVFVARVLALTAAGTLAAACTSSTPVVDGVTESTTVVTAATDRTQTTASADEFFRVDPATDEVLGTVNGDNITRSELFRAIGASRSNQSVGGAIELGSAETAGAMTNLIGIEMLRRPAAAVGVEFSEFLTGNPSTEEAELLGVFEDIGDALLGIRSPGDSEAVIDEHLASLPAIDRPVCSRHIVVASDEEARSVIDLLESGREFETLAATISDDESAEFGGYLGCGPAAGFIPVFAAALTDLEVGELSAPVETEFGFHVIRRDELEAGARTQLLGQLRNGLLGPFVDDAFASAVVTIDPRIGRWEGGVVVPPDA